MEAQGVLEGCENVIWHHPDSAGRDAEVTVT
jgi:hypothetical protein